jgi:hypothetical protein
LIYLLKKSRRMAIRRVSGLLERTPVRDNY